MKKKIWLSVLVVCVGVLFVGTMSVSAETYGDLTYTISNNEVTITDCETTVTSIELPSEIDGYKVTEISDMAFLNCINMTSIKLPSSINKIGSAAFDGCPALKNVYITDIESWCNIKFSMPSSNPLYNGGKLYLNNTLVTTLSLADGTTTIASNAFYNYTYLTKLSVPSSVIYIGDRAFYNTSWLNNQDDGVVYIGNVAYIYKGEMQPNKKIILKNNTVGIAGYAFKDCENLISINIPNSTTYIGDCAFYGCTNLNECILPTNLTQIGSSAFTSCKNIKNITMPDTVTDLGNYAFSYCTGLQNVKLSENLLWVPHGAFYRCISLNSINIPQHATMIGTMAFDGCSLIESLNIPETMSVIYEDSFTECKIRKIYISNIESWCKIDIKPGWNSNSQQVFNDYDLYLNDVLLTNVEIPKNITTIKRYAFSGCTSIEKVILSNSIIDINYGAFSKCTSLNSITMPKSISAISNLAFYRSGVKDIYYEGSIEDWQKITIGNNNTALTSANVYYYFGKVVTKTSISNNNKTFLIVPQNATLGNNIILVLYDGNKMVDVLVTTYEGNDIVFTTNKTYTTAKVMVWESMSTLQPLSDVEEILITSSSN